MSLENTKNIKENLLASEKSPYLLQHRLNPVSWRPWGEEAFELAKKEAKPIFLSIGYSTCYWCHVMEKECFEDAEVAAVLNKEFINIKLDREERPDVDAIYMDFIQGISGRGGWPMSVFLSATGEPFYGGTYFPKDDFLKLVSGVKKAWVNEKDALLVNGAKFREFLSSQKLPKEEILSSDNLEEKLSSLFDNFQNAAFTQLEDSYDPHFGGFSEAPKFPPSVKLEFLLRVNRKLKTKNEAKAKQALSMTSYTLDKMAAGGFYDQLEGGFHRYSVDNKWHLPHFEKMLYDNSMLAKTYIEAYQFTKKDKYKSVAKETLDYLDSRMKSKEAAFFSAEDAGDAGKEGEFYLWRYSELETVLSESELKTLEEVYSVKPEGNFEPEAGPTEGLNVFSLNFGVTLETSREKELAEIKSKLLKVRDERERPFQDDKILTAWNGLAIDAFSIAGRVFEEDKYINASKEAVDFIVNNLYKDERLLRRHREGEAKGDAFLNDYAFLINGLLSLFEACQDFKYLDLAKGLQEAQDKIFWDESDQAYFFAGAEDKTLIARTKEFADSALPSGNGVSALNNLRLSKLCCEPSYKKRAEKMLLAISPLLNHSPSHFGSYLLASDYYLANS